MQSLGDLFPDYQRALVETPLGRVCMRGCPRIEATYIRWRFRLRSILSGRYRSSLYGY